MSDPAIEIEVEDPAWRVINDVEQLVSQAAAAALAGLDGGNRPDAGGIVVLLADDAAVAELNQQFRDKGGPTNVLSFPAPTNPEGLLGDIALAFGVCSREAEEQSKSLEDHLRHLTVHGVLHLAGFDHQTDDEAQLMEDLERRVLAGLGVSDPYAAD
jgi:probable rRNA maturation factor